MPNRPLPLLAAAALAAGLALAPATAGIAAPAADAAKTYRNCTEIRKVWSGGIAKQGVTHNRTPHGNRALKGRVKFSTPLYQANRKSDRDRDGIACERD